jgi:hypothetical protein
LVNPKTFNYSTATYANSTDDRFWKSFNLGTASAGVIDYSLMFDLEADYDFWAVYARNSSGDPVPSGTLLGATSGTSDGYRIPISHEITPFIGTNTTIGFRLLSDNINNDFGVNVSSLSFTLLSWNNTTYNILAGTSMAAPHVAGLAALIGSFNPNYTYSEIIESIKSGGTSVTSLAGKSATGKAINAHGSLTFVSQPKSVSVSFP